MSTTQRGCPRTPLAAALLVTLLTGPRGLADEPRTLVLFDGKSLDGWKITDFYDKGEVNVENGAIILGKGSMTGVTTTRDDLPRLDYELTYEAQRLDGSDFFAAATFPVGKSYVTLVNGGWGGTVTGISSINGADASENETGTYFEYKDKTWYRFRVRVTDERIRCWINDEELIDLDLEGKQLGTRLETRISEPLGFATWDTSGAVRNIKMRTLTPDEVKATNAEDK